LSDNYLTSSHSDRNKDNNSESPFIEDLSIEDLPTNDPPTDYPPTNDLFSDNLPINNSEGKGEIDFESFSDSDREHDLETVMADDRPQYYNV
jgi:hypothetical protein